MRLAQGEIVAIIRGVAAEDVSAIARVLLDEGISWMEVSLSEEEMGLACIRTLAAAFGDSLQLGVGTVTTAAQADKAIEAGARYIITPGWDRELTRYVLAKGVDIFPGVFTPGEVMQALADGVDVVKLFPAGSLGTDFVKQLFGPFPRLQLMAVGGINRSNLQDFYAAGCRSFGIGSDLVPRGATGEQLEQIQKNAAEYMKLVQTLKK
ncbi:bifunctional 4-hydroxy-2-oxoglutarate aldolase/2-dehydro-3-deoxy-phosphogluconate aldolase [Brevibacillus humidisoli]|uniref:bifunctional 4-hydroxy-2-oxoglutarate aldolase/2-dehydro-3-deoxy-phosphogluconate aldolase n=1 Tax=Brevibacillus humidisoli TaxID=2895522 RepID=UPI001E30C515|nr:bifunctional 4-hydroxy-2-oxoglutarate aldolase/2-dehydro-3-deoxy-phosphogluconate aldolase [Brevibacillus humidisoli]UFJ41776.1 bifunctional 4-hydroxy-2-oxoglutarate aldolase/2-dehydro-3-deoxy-phosphogluconate aldolase [Brevibacillus humidisoli]